MDKNNFFNKCIKGRKCSKEELNSFFVEAARAFLEADRKDFNRLMKNYDEYKEYIEE